MMLPFPDRHAPVEPADLRGARPTPLFALVLGLLIAGCAPSTPGNQLSRSWSTGHPTPATNAPASPPAEPKPKSSRPPPPKPATLAPDLPPTDPPPRYPLLTAVEQSVGRISMVNTQALFVVIDFGFNPLPRTNQRLKVYRTDQAIGTVRTTGAPRGSLMAADIMAGTAEVGDEVRPE